MAKKELKHEEKLWIKVFSNHLKTDGTWSHNEAMISANRAVENFKLFKIKNNEKTH